MAGTRSSPWQGLRSIVGLVIAFAVVAASVLASEARLQPNESGNGADQISQSHHPQGSNSGYKLVWPTFKFGWKIVVGVILGFVGAAFGTAGGVGGGGIYIPMLTLIIGFDPKSAAAISKFMITGAAAGTVFYNIKQRHPTVEMPMIDYDLALLFQPMLVLGVSVGVAFNVLFAEWMITVLLIIVFLYVSTKAFLKGVERWKKETIAKQEATHSVQSNGIKNEETITTEGAKNSCNGETEKECKKEKVSVAKNVYWKQLGLLLSVWMIILSLQILQSQTTKCSLTYWVLNLAQVPMAGGVSVYQAISIYKGRRRIQSTEVEGINWGVQRLVIYLFCGLLGGIVAGLLGLGGGFILGPLLLEMGVPPQASSATSTFAMTFSAAIGVVEYYLLKRFPIPYGLFLLGVATISGFIGQHIVKKLIDVLGRASVIVFILSFTVFISALTLGAVGLEHTIKKIEHKEYMGFYSICLNN